MNNKLQVEEGQLIDSDGKQQRRGQFIVFEEMLVPISRNIKRSMKAYSILTSTL